MPNSTMGALVADLADVGKALFKCLNHFETILIVSYNFHFSMGRVIDANEKHIIHPEIRLQRILVHNSISIYAMWTTIASLLNINAAFQYFGPYDGEVTSAICCILLLILLIGWFVLENTIFDPDVRYILAQYPGNFPSFKSTRTAPLIHPILLRLLRCSGDIRFWSNAGSPKKGGGSDSAECFRIDVGTSGCFNHFIRVPIGHR